MDARVLQQALFFFLCVVFISGTSIAEKTSKLSNQVKQAVPSSSGGTWCIANPTASQTALQVALDYACGYGGADCSAIQPSGACYEPNMVLDHASYAFNGYYRRNPVPTSCAFGGTAQVTSTDPSHGNCRYLPASSTPTAVPTTPTPPVMPTATSTTSPVVQYPPVGSNSLGSGYDDNAGPDGASSSAEKLSRNYMQHFVVTLNCLSLSLAVTGFVI